MQTAFVSLFYIFINMKPWNAYYPGTRGSTRAFNEFLYEFLRMFLISENSLKFANFLLR